MSEVRETPSQKNLLLRWILFTTSLLHAAGLYQFVMPAIQAGFLPGSIKWTAVSLAAAGLLAIEILLLALTWTRALEKIYLGLNWITMQFSRLRWVNVLLFVLAAAGFTYLVLSPSGVHFSGAFTRLFLFWGLVLAGCFLLKAFNFGMKSPVQYPWLSVLAISLVFSAFIYNFLSLFQDISLYPFTLGWSETSRYYYASLFLSEPIYGFQIPPSVLHPSRYLMQAVPFLIPVSPLWLHRAWQVFLWIAVSLATSAVLANRLGFSRANILRRGLFIAWVFAFLMIGPVYYHLQIPLILMLWGFERNPTDKPLTRFSKNLLVLTAASIWAGISRVNWYPVPGLLAAVILFLEHPVWQADRQPITQNKTNDKIFTWPVLRYGLPAVGWTAFGSAAAFAAQTVYVLWSGNNAREFTSSFSSDLLWYRLWPSPTYPVGILPGILLVSLPLWMVVWQSLRRSPSNQPVWRLVHPIRWIGLFTILLVLFAGGLVVSVKIGGGSNLHNMDAYLSLLLVAVSWIAFNKLRLDQPLPEEPVSGIGTFGRRDLSPAYCTKAEHLPRYIVERRQPWFEHVDGLPFYLIFAWSTIKIARPGDNPTRACGDHARRRVCE